MTVLSHSCRQTLPLVGDGLALRLPSAGALPGPHYRYINQPNRAGPGRWILVNLNLRQAGGIDDIQQLIAGRRVIDWYHQTVHHYRAVEVRAVGPAFHMILHPVPRAVPLVHIPAGPRRRHPFSLRPICNLPGSRGIGRRIRRIRAPNAGLPQPIRWLIDIELQVCDIACGIHLQQGGIGDGRSLDSGITRGEPLPTGPGRT